MADVRKGKVEREARKDPDTGERETGFRVTNREGESMWCAMDEWHVASQLIMSALNGPAIAVVEYTVPPPGRMPGPSQAGGLH